MVVYSCDDYVEDPFLATGKLSELLRTGSLRLFLGAGVSSGFGLPEWKVLVARVLARENDVDFFTKLAAMSAKEQAKLIDELDDESLKYINLVRSALYGDVPDDFAARQQRSPLLLAVAALLTGTCRGRVDSVVTYNYDDLLEQYLEMLGYRVCVRTRPDQISTRAEVEISHPHGWIPQQWDHGTQPVQPVLSDRSYRERRAEIDSGWSAIIEHGLMSKIGLFLGLSGDDESVMDVLKRTQKSIKRSGDYLGYWLLTPDAFERNKGAVKDVGMCAIALTKEQMPAFLLEICKKAARP